MDALLEDLARMFGHMSFCNGKGCYVDSVTDQCLREHYARDSSVDAMVGFLNYYAGLHPELVGAQVKHSKEWLEGLKVYRLKSDEAFLDRRRLEVLLTAMRTRKPADAKSAVADGDKPSASGKAV